nr:MAG TPA: hypothetical protein [Caudoviricetes sp.]
MAKSKRYNPYEDAKNILKYKGNYHTAKQMGTNYDQYKEAAKPYYQNLRFNGYGDLADQFDKSDFIQAQELFKGLKPDTTVDDYFADLYSKTAESQSTPKISQAAEDMWNAWNNTNTTLNGNEIKYDRNGNVVSGLNVDHYNTGRNQLGYLNNFDVTAQPYYQGIMNSFQLQGNNAARGEQATGAANNAGNIDSYAQANANRQQLAFTSKGLEAALAAANQNQQNWQTLYDSMTGHLDNMGNQNANVLNAYQNIYSTDSLERQNTLNTAAELAKQEMQSKIDKYLEDVGYDKAVYTADKNLEGSKYGADANTLAAQIAADADKYAAQQNYAGKVYASDTDKAIAELKNGNTRTVYGGLNGDAVDAKTLARQVYDAYKTGEMPEVESQYDFERLLIAAGMSEKDAEEWAEYYLKHDKDMFKSNPSSNSSSSSADDRKIGGGLIKVPTGGNNNIYRP